MSVFSAFFEGAAEDLAGVEDLAGALEAVLPKLNSMVIGCKFVSRVGEDSIPTHLSGVSGDNREEGDQQDGSEHDYCGVSGWRPSKIWLCMAMKHEASLYSGRAVAAVETKAAILFFNESGA